jgi:probable blue pigment (indigoidine) exporter
MNMKVSSGSSATTAAVTVLAPISWGTTYVTVTELLPAGRPILLASLRVVPAGLALVVAGVVASRWRPRGPEWKRTAKLTIFNFGFFFPLLSVAVYRLPGGVAAAVGGLQPLFVGALSWPLAGRRPRARDLAIGLAAALGVALVAIRPGADLDPVGLLAAVGANLSFAIGVVLTKRYPAPSNRIAATGWQLLMGGAVLLPLAFIVEGAPPPLSARNLAGFTYLSMVGTAFAFIVWFNGVRRLPTAAPPLLGLAAPITGATLGWVVLGQSLSPLQATGFAITIGAIVYGATLSPSAAERYGDDDGHSICGNSCDNRCDTDDVALGRVRRSRVERRDCRGGSASRRPRSVAPSGWSSRRGTSSHTSPTARDPARLARERTKPH